MDFFPDDEYRSPRERGHVLIEQMTVDRLTDLCVLQSEYPEYRFRNEWYGIVPDIWMNAIRVRERFMERSCEIVVKLHTPSTWKRKMKRNPVKYSMFERYHITPGKRNCALSAKRALKEFSFSAHALEQIPVPVIGVGALYKDLDRTALTSRIKRAAGLFGRKLATVYTDRDYSRFGCNCIPRDLIGKLSFEDRILFINYYIRRVVEAEKPETVVVEIPGGILPMGSQNLNGGGEFPFIFMQALMPDYFICTLPFQHYSGDDIGTYEKRIAHRYGVKSISFHLTNTYFLPLEMSNGQDAAGVWTSPNDALYRSLLLEREQGCSCFSMLWKDEIIKWSKRVAG
ncbi:MAG: hypothetical protein IJP92_10525 [Lachnospiraceae bacterium]|nr:hypothetical protein [Lachnospiraceae bacterium]